MSWVSRLVVSDKEKAALCLYVAPLVAAAKVTPTSHNESLPDTVRTNIRKFVKVYLWINGLGFGAKQILHVAQQVLVLKQLPVVNVAVLRAFALFASLLVSTRPIFKKVLEFAGPQAAEILGNLAASAVAVQFYPKEFIFETGAIWYFSFGLEYLYKLYESRQLRHEKNGSISPESLGRKLYEAVRQRSWLLFPVASAIYWKNFVLEPTRAHDLPTKLFTAVGEKLQIYPLDTDLIAALRGAGNTRKLSQYGGWSHLLGRVPGAYFVAVKLAVVLISVKTFVIQNAKLREDLKLHSPQEVAVSRACEAVKLSVLLGGVPLTSYLLTTLVLRHKVLGPQKLRMIGFVAGLIASIYKGRPREAGETDISLETTNRGAWIGMLRESIIASLVAQPGFDRYARVAFVAGLASVFLVQDYEKRSKEETEKEVVFGDAPFLSYLTRVSN